jgi:hypothetical protein
LSRAGSDDAAIVFRRDRKVWWISYRGESGHGVDNIGVFEDDGSPRKVHPLLLDPSPAAHPRCILRAASHW